MIASGCWKCGANTHHGRDCESFVSEDSAALMKRQSRFDLKHTQKKSDVENKKWLEKCKIRNELPLPVSLAYLV